MDQTCPTCGLAVASGMPFCSGCRAPQIRFVPPVSAPTTTQETSEDGERLPLATPLSLYPALRAALIGGVFSVFSLGLPGSLLGFGFMAGGTLAVYTYRKRVPGAVLNLGSGSLLGAASGLFGFLISTFLAVVKILLQRNGSQIRQTTFAAMDKVVVQTTDPQVQQSVQMMVQQFKTPDGFALLIALCALIVCLMFVFFSVLGGAIGANITRRNLK